MWSLIRLQQDTWRPMELNLVTKTCSPYFRGILIFIYVQCRTSCMAPVISELFSNCRLTVWSKISSFWAWTWFLNAFTTQTIQTIIWLLANVIPRLTLQICSLKKRLYFLRMKNNSKIYLCNYLPINIFFIKRLHILNVTEVFLF